MTALWICLALCVGTLFGYCLRAGMERANRESRPVADPSVRYPLDAESKRQLVADLNEARQRRASR